MSKKEEGGGKYIIRRFIVCTPYIILNNNYNKVKEDTKRRMRNTRGKNIRRIIFRKKVRDHLGYVKKGTIAY
jgi:hypothetical protein